MSLTYDPDEGLADQQPSQTLVDEHEDRGQEQQDTPAVWLIRAGRDGDRFDYNVENGLACLGWDDIPDLRGFTSRQELQDAMRSHYPDRGEGTISSHTSQLWRMRTDVRQGDLVVMPRKGARELALGSVTREYWYDTASEMGWGRHVVSVDWKRTEVPRAALELDLQNSLGAQMTICAITRHDASWRFQQLLETGRDPGPRMDRSSSTDPVDLIKLAGELLVDVEFLEDIVSLLEDKGQAILYGPPGTGKTYLARALAKVLAPGEACRALVQFHPSTSYEDFFEGYRPAGTGHDGNVRYELTPGPLARMAEQASEAPERQHVMIIDEINRGNLPRVLGELLFLLEYRNESVQPLYRPDEPFSLPDNLWFIGTMNTADRSIALVDAALRRRFHFVPFFPDREPMAGLLGRWLERQGGPGWVGGLVAEVNEELKEVLEGSHLLLGPSHFMKKYGPSLNEQRRRLRRIWEYNIEPFIEDQFFGAPDQIASFRFDAVMKRHGPAATSDDGPENTEDSEDEPAPQAPGVVGEDARGDGADGES